MVCRQLRALSSGLSIAMTQQHTQPARGMRDFLPDDSGGVYVIDVVSSAKRYG